MKRASAKPARAALPAFIEPCLASLVREPPSGDQWVHEIKFDGYRLQARIEDGRVKLLTRRGLDWTVRFSALARSLQGLGAKSALIDGEAVVEDDKGRSSFVMLVDELKAGRSARIAFVAFDLLHLDGISLETSTLDDRKACLKLLLQRMRKGEPIRYSEHIRGDGKALLTETCRLGLEGLISKRIDLPYRSGRRDDWLKSKCLQSDELVIGGYLDSTAVRDSVGALALGYFAGKRLVYAGRVGTGFSRQTAGDLWQRLQKLRTTDSPFTAPLDATQRRGVVWVKPRLVAQIDYRSWTGDGLLRHASFKALREDKPAREVGQPLMRSVESR